MDGIYFPFNSFHSIHGYKYPTVTRQRHSHWKEVGCRRSQWRRMRRRWWWWRRTTTICSVYYSHLIVTKCDIQIYVDAIKPQAPLPILWTEHEHRRSHLQQWRLLSINKSIHLCDSTWTMYSCKIILMNRIKHDDWRILLTKTVVIRTTSDTLSLTKAAEPSLLNPRVNFLSAIIRTPKSKIHFIMNSFVTLSR